MGLGVHRFEHERLDLLGLALHAESAEWPDPRQIADEGVGRGGDDHLPRLRARLEARGEVHGVAMGHEVAELFAPDVPNECRTACDADAEPRERGILANDRLDRLLHRQGGAGRREGVPRLVDGRVEHRDDRIARELDDRSAVREDHRDDRAEVAIQQLHGLGRLRLPIVLIEIPNSNAIGLCVMPRARRSSVAHSRTVSGRECDADDRPSRRTGSITSWASELRKRWRL